MFSLIFTTLDLNVNISCLSAKCILRLLNYTCRWFLILKSRGNFKVWKKNEFNKGRISGWDIFLIRSELNNYLCADHNLSNYWFICEVNILQDIPYFKMSSNIFVLINRIILYSEGCNECCIGFTLMCIFFFVFHNFLEQ